MAMLYFLYITITTIITWIDKADAVVRKQNFISIVRMKTIPALFSLSSCVHSILHFSAIFEYSNIHFLPLYEFRLGPHSVLIMGKQCNGGPDAVMGWDNSIVGLFNPTFSFLPFNAFNFAFMIHSQWHFHFHRLSKCHFHC